MKVAFLHTHDSAVADYRQWVPARALVKKGHKIWFRPDTDGWAVGLKSEDMDAFLMGLASKYDIIHTGYTHALGFVQAMASLRNYAKKVLGKNLPVIVDCDDDLLSVPDYNIAFKQYQVIGDAKRKTLWQFKNSDALSVTTPWLQKQYDKLTQEVAVLPNCVEPEVWEGWASDPRLAASEDVRIMFAGGIGRKGDLDSIRDAIEIVMRSRPQARLFFMAMMPDWVQEQWAASPDDPSKNRAFFIWHGDQYLYRQVMSWVKPHIVIAPVLPNDFNRGKSNIKVMEAAMFGAASVCSDWETYGDVPKECVLRADTTYEWKESILALIDDTTLRAKKAKACKDWVLTERSIDSKVHLWEDLYERALARPVIGEDGSGIRDIGVEVLKEANAPRIIGV